MFYNYSCDDKINCTRSYPTEKIPYAVLKSMQQRKERSDAIRRNPDLKKVFRYRKFR